jgi:hypothetical protein
MYYAAIHNDEYLWIYGTQKKKEGNYLNLHQGDMEVNGIFSLDKEVLERFRNEIEMAIIEANLKGLAVIPDMSFPPLNLNDVESEETYFQDWVDESAIIGDRGFLKVTDTEISWIPVKMEKQITFTIEIPEEPADTPESPNTVKVASIEELLAGINTKVKKVEAKVD